MSWLINATSAARASKSSHIWFSPLFGAGRGGSVLCISILNYLISSLGLSTLERGEGRLQGCRLERVEKLYTEHRIVFNLFWLSTSSSILWRHSGGDHQLSSVTGSSKSQWMIMSRNVNYKCIYSKKASGDPNLSQFSCAAIFLTLGFLSRHTRRTRWKRDQS